MSQSRRAKKERRRQRKWAEDIEQGANRIEREGRAPAEVVTALRKAAATGKALGTISGRKKLKQKGPSPTN
jgi:hypothetical protein